MTRERAIELLREIEDEYGEPIEMAIEALKERKTGKWVRQTDDYHDYYECENCGIAVGLDDVKNYCPKCGAKMEVEDGTGDASVGE